jgi:activator of 2-hydroxyglutaryl-CoA dehydratase
MAGGMIQETGQDGGLQTYTSYISFDNYCIFFMKSGIIDSLKKGDKAEELPVDI